MIDQNLLPAALTVFCSFLLVALIVLNASGSKAAQRQRDAYSLMASPPEHYWVDNEPSAGATLFSMLLCLIGAYIGLSLLFGHVLFLS